MGKKEKEKYVIIILYLILYTVFFSCGYTIAMYQKNVIRIPTIYQTEIKYNETANSLDVLYTESFTSVTGEVSDNPQSVTATTSVSAKVEDNPQSYMFFTKVEIKQDKVLFEFVIKDKWGNNITSLFYILVYNSTWSEENKCRFVLHSGDYNITATWKDVIKLFRIESLTQSTIKEYIINYYYNKTQDFEVFCSHRPLNLTWLEDKKELNITIDVPSGEIGEAIIYTPLGKPKRVYVYDTVIKEVSSEEEYNATEECWLWYSNQSVLKVKGKAHSPLIIRVSYAEVVTTTPVAPPSTPAPEQKLYIYRIDYPNEVVQNEDFNITVIIRSTYITPQTGFIRIYMNNTVIFSKTFSIVNETIISATLHAPNQTGIIVMRIEVGVSNVEDSKQFIITVKAKPKPLIPIPEEVEKTIKYIKYLLSKPVIRLFTALILIVMSIVLIRTMKTVNVAIGIITLLFALYLLILSLPSLLKYLPFKLPKLPELPKPSYEILNTLSDLINRLKEILKV